MNKSPLPVTARRELLVVQIAQQRAALAQDIEPWRPPLARVYQGLLVLRYLKQHPVWITVGFAALLVVRHRSVGKWWWFGWRAWRILRH